MLSAAQQSGECRSVKKEEKHPLPFLPPFSFHLLPSPGAQESEE
jgi:hypothetical protein